MCGSSDQQDELLRDQSSFSKQTIAQQNAAFQKQMSFYEELTRNFKELYSDQQGILDALTATFRPILEAGPGQKGFTAGEEASFRTEATDLTAEGAQRASIALQSKLASQGGGSEFLPSGGEAQLQAGLMSSAENQRARLQSGITQRNYDVGRQNFYSAAEALGGVAQQKNPLGFAGTATNALSSITPFTTAATQAGGLASGTAADINAANQAWMGPVFGALGGIAGAAIPHIPGGGGGAPARAA